MNASWPDIYKALFGRLIDTEETQAWQALLDEDFAGRGVDNYGRWSSQELIAALRAVSEERRRVGIKGRAPEYAEVKTYMIRARMNARKDQEPPVADSRCGLCCGSGMLLVFPGLPDDSGGMENEAGEYSKSVPCRCAYGNKHHDAIKNNKHNEITPEVAGRIEALRGKAVRQAQSRQRAAGAVVAAVPPPAWARGVAEIGPDDDLEEVLAP
jgi:hypothetical protein